MKGMKSVFTKRPQYLRKRLCDVLEIGFCNFDWAVFFVCCFVLKIKDFLHYFASIGKISNIFDFVRSVAEIGWSMSWRSSADGISGVRWARYCFSEYNMMPSIAQGWACMAFSVCDIKWGAVGGKWCHWCVFRPHSLVVGLGVAVWCWVLKHLIK